MEENNKINKQSGKAVAGLIIVVIGAALLLNNIGVDIPSWIFYWSNILILIGLFVSVKHRFRDNKGFILIGIGLFFTLKEALGNHYDFDRIGWPVLIIAVGLLLIFRTKGNTIGSKSRRRDEWARKFGVSDTLGTGDGLDSEFPANSSAAINNEDYLESVSVFSGSHQIVFSKSFKGGEVTAVFGGCDVNLTQADFDGQVVIDATAIFGGVKLIVPAGWQIKQEVTCIFGGLDDKRTLQAPVGSTKILVIRGVALFGGVDIRSY